LTFKEETQKPEFKLFNSWKFRFNKRKVKFVAVDVTCWELVENINLEVTGLAWPEVFRR
jgi:hypothetical protein